MLLLDKRNRAHPEDGVAAPGCSKDKKCPAELRAERAVRAYFSLDKTRSLGVAAFFLEILAFPPKDRVTQLLYCRDAVHLHGPAPVLRANPGDIRGGDVEARPRQLRNSDGGGVDVRRREHHVDDVRGWVVCHPKP